MQNYEEFEFIEKDKILKDLCQSKILLEKTSHLTPETSSKPPIYQQSKPSTPYQNMSSSYQTSSGSLSSSPQYHSRVRSNNFLPNTSNSNYFSSDSFTHSKTVESQNFSRFTNSLNGMDLVIYLIILFDLFKLSIIFIYQSLKIVFSLILIFQISIQNLRLIQLK